MPAIRRSISGDREMRADIEQGVALRALRARALWHIGIAIAAARYEAKDRWRAAKVMTEPLTELHADTIPAPGLTPEELAICRQEIVAAVKPLRWKATAALVAAALGFSYAEIGRVIGIKGRSVQTLVWRARKRLGGRR